MGTFTWIGSDGDWNDPTNWSGETIPTPEDTVQFSSTASATLEGAAYIGQIELGGADLTISGDFSNEADQSAVVTDQGSETTDSTLCVDPWASLQITNLSLSTVSLVDLGALITEAASIDSGSVDGQAADWFGNETAVAGTLAVYNGGTFAGNLLLENNAALAIDSTANLVGGSITAEGSATVLATQLPNLVGTSATIDDDLSLDQGSVLTIYGTGGQQITLGGTVDGPGTLAVVGASLVLVATAQSGATSTDLAGEQLRSAASEDADVKSDGPTYELSSSVLDLRQSSPATAAPTILCSGDADAVFGGSAAFSVVSSGASLIDVQAGTGSNTVSAGSSALSYVQGLGQAVVSCGSSGRDSVQVGLANAVVQTSQGANVQVVGDASITVESGAGDSCIDDRSGVGNLTLYCNQGSGTTSVSAGSGDLAIYGVTGALSVVGGSGELTVWGGSSGQDTLSGGSGVETLVGGANCSVIAKSSHAGLYGTSASNAVIDASASSGNDTIFATSGPGTTSLVGGAGSDLFLGGSGTDIIQCGSGFDYVWAGSGTGNTVQGGTGQAVIDAGNASQVNLKGPSSDTVIASAGETTVNRGTSAGSLTVFANNGGSASVTGGAGTLITVVDHAVLNVNDNTGSSMIWCTDGASVNVANASPINVVAAGAACTVDCAGSSTSGTFFVGGGENDHLVLGNGANCVIGGQYASSVNIGAGFNTIFGGAGALNVDFSAASSLAGTTTIVGYDASRDALFFSRGSDVTTSQTKWGELLSTGHQDVLLYSFFGNANTSFGH